MRAEAVTEALVGAGCPQLTSPEEGRELYDFIIEHRPEAILELGFAHGCSTAYLAGALNDVGVGKVTSMDREEALERKPNAETVLRLLGLDGRVDFVYAAT